MLKTGEAYRSHITAYRKTIKTTIRMDADLWSEYKKEVHSLNLTTCLVIRGLIREWIGDVRSLFSPTKMKNTKEPFGISRFTHEEKEERWIYSKMTMTLYDPKHLQGRQRTKQRRRLEKQRRYRRIV